VVVVAVEVGVLAEVLNEVGALDCAFEAICEGCGNFHTAVESRPRLEARRDHAKTMVSRIARTSTSVAAPSSTATLQRADEPPETIGWACSAQPITGISRVPLDGSPE